MLCGHKVAPEPCAVKMNPLRRLWCCCFKDFVKLTGKKDFVFTDSLLYVFIFLSSIIYAFTYVWGPPEKILLLEVPFTVGELSWGQCPSLIPSFHLEKRAESTVVWGPEELQKGQGPKDSENVFSPWLLEGDAPWFSGKGLKDAKPFLKMLIQL